VYQYGSLKPGFIPQTVSAGSVALTAQIQGWSPTQGFIRVYKASGGTSIDGVSFVASSQHAVSPRGVSGSIRSVDK